jgi:hypothetical protein
MKLRIRGNSIRLRVSKTELAKIADQGTAEDSVRFTSSIELKYGIDVRPSGAVTAAFDGSSLRVTLPKSRLDLWLRPEEVSVEGSQPIGGGKALQILLEKDYTCLAPRAGEDDSDSFANPLAKTRSPKG